MGEKHTREELDNGYRYHIVRDGVLRIVVDGHELRDGDIVEDVEVPDTREKLEADVLRFVREITDEALVMGAHEASWYPNIGGLRECIAAYLDRQAAITERECMERATSERVGWDCAKCAEGLGKYADSLCDPLKERIAELTADRDKLGISCWKLESELAEKQRVCDVQRESFRKMEADLAATRHAALGLWRRMDALRMAGRAPSQEDLDEMAALLAGLGIEAS